MKNATAGEKENKKGDGGGGRAGAVSATAKETPRHPLLPALSPQLNSRARRCQLRKLSFAERAAANFFMRKEGEKNEHQQTCCKMLYSRINFPHANRVLRKLFKVEDSYCKLMSSQSFSYILDQETIRFCIIDC
jgi:hypothetical protein